MNLRYEIKLNIVAVDPDNRSSIAKQTVTAATLDTLADAEELFEKIVAEIRVGSLQTKLLAKLDLAPLFQTNPPYRRGAA